MYLFCSSTSSHPIFNQPLSGLITVDRFSSIRQHPGYLGKSPPLHRRPLKHPPCSSLDRLVASRDPSSLKPFQSAPFLLPFLRPFDTSLSLSRRPFFDSQLPSTHKLLTRELITRNRLPNQSNLLEYLYRCQSPSSKTRGGLPHLPLLQCSFFFTATSQTPTSCDSLFFVDNSRQQRLHYLALDGDHFRQIERISTRDLERRAIWFGEAQNRVQRNTSAFNFFSRFQLCDEALFINSTSLDFCQRNQDGTIYCPANKKHP